MKTDMATGSDLSLKSKDRTRIQSYFIMMNNLQEKF